MIYIYIYIYIRYGEGETGEKRESRKTSPLPPNVACRTDPEAGRDRRERRERRERQGEEGEEGEEGETGRQGGGRRGRQTEGGGGRAKGTSKRRPASAAEPRRACALRSVAYVTRSGLSLGNFASHIACYMLSFSVQYMCGYLYFQF